MRERSEKLGLVAAALCAAQAGFELVRVILTRGELQGWGRAIPLVSSGIFIVVLALAAVGLATRRPWGYVFAVFGMLVSLGYGAILVTPNGPNIGIAYMIGGLALLYCIGRSIPAYRRGPAPV